MNILKLIRQVIYGFSEKTPPSVKYSKNNYLVAKIVEAIDEYIKFKKQK